MLRVGRFKLINIPNSRSVYKGGGVIAPCDSVPEFDTLSRFCATLNSPFSPRLFKPVRGFLLSLSIHDCVPFEKCYAASATILSFISSRHLFKIWISVKRSTVPFLYFVLPFYILFILVILQFARKL